MTTATDTRPRVWAFWHAPGGRGHNDEGVWHVVHWSSQGQLPPQGITRCAHCSGALPVGDCAGGAFTCEYQLALRGHAREPRSPGWIGPLARNRLRAPRGLAMSAQLVQGPILHHPMGLDVTT